MLHHASRQTLCIYIRNCIKIENNLWILRIGQWPINLCMYIPNHKYIYPLCRIQLKRRTQLNYPTNQNWIKVPKVVKQMNKNKAFGIILINSPLSPLTLCKLPNCLQLTINNSLTYCYCAMRKRINTTNKQPEYSRLQTFCPLFMYCTNSKYLVFASISVHLKRTPIAKH